MSKKSLSLVIPLLAALALTAGSGSLFAQGPAGSGPQDMVSTAFTYQGQLKDSSGNLVTDTCDFRFSAWDMSSGGGQVGSNCNVTGVAVSNGYFTAQVNAGGEFGGSAFQGEARWLQIAVKCTGDASYTTLSPRQPLTAAPYALGLMPGAKVVGDVSGGAALRAENTAASGSTYGLNGQAASTDGTGVLGWATAISGTTYGVLGRSASTDGIGVKGRAAATSGTTYGVYGQAVSPNGTGVYGTANIAVEGQTTGWLAVYGTNTSTDTTSTHIGVAGETYGTDVDNRNSVAVQGYATNPNGGIGVRGLTAGAGIAVLGESQGTTGTGVYGNGNIGVQGETDGWLAVYGKNTSTDTTSTHIGVAGETYGTDIAGDKNIAVQGYAANPGGGIGVRGRTAGMGIAVEGQAMAQSGYAYGVFAESYSSDGIGVFGKAAASSGLAYGVYGESFSSDGVGVYGEGNIAVEGKSSGWLAILGTNTSMDTTSAHIGVAGETAGTDIDNRNSVAVQGYATNPNGGIGVRGLTAGMGIAVLGESRATSGAGYGVEGLSASTGGTGVYGYAAATSGGARGVYGLSASTGGWGVYGSASATSGVTVGVEGDTEAPGKVVGSLILRSKGVWGMAWNPSGYTVGVSGQVISSNGYGVEGSAPLTGTVGIATAASGTTYGVYGQADSAAGTGVYGYNSAGSGGTGVYGAGSSHGVWGVSTATSGGTLGVYGQSNSAGGIGVQGEGAWCGVRGVTTSTSGWAVSGIAGADSGSTVGVAGTVESTDGIGVRGYAPTPGWAGYFNGQVNITGDLFKGGGGFKIDDPLDPAHKYLYHSFVESPDMKNIYDGVVTLDQDGTAWVDMPDWFQVVNQDFRYQLTCIGGYAPVYVAEEIQGNRFQVAGGTPGLKVSWQVTGIRHDPFAEAYPIPVEQDKPASAQGTYLHPELYGQPASAGESYSRQHAGPAVLPSPAPAPAGQPR